MKLHLAYPRNKTEMRAVIGDRLFVVEHEGERWATNAYWLMPADKLSLVLSADGVAEPGAYFGDKRLEPTDQGAPPVDRLLNIDDYTAPLEVVETAGKPTLVAYTAAEKRGDETLGVVLRRPDLDELTMLNARYLRVVADTSTARYGERLGDPVLRQKPHEMVKGKPSANGPVGIFAPVEVKRGGHRDTTTDAYKWIPETWHADGERLLGVLMPVRLT